MSGIGRSATVEADRAGLITDVNLLDQFHCETPVDVVFFNLNVPLLGHWLDHVPVMTVVLRNYSRRDEFG